MNFFPGVSSVEKSEKKKLKFENIQKSKEFYKEWICFLFISQRID